jgi:23S rRNA (guanine745-N1)-methyltransferase
MNIVTADNLACPLDGMRLELYKKQLVCENGHAFDIARQGYVNLLLVQHKRSKQPGDSKAMVLARTSFLNTGIYQAIADKLTETVSALITNDKSCCILDAGCGEGYYFDALLNRLKKEEGASDLSFIGLDISKDAIVQATKRTKQITWVVGTNRQPPVENESVDIILCLFGFFNAEGFYKSLKPGGKIILVDPGSDHLKELRKIIYPEVKKSKQEDASQIRGMEFTMLSSDELRFKVNVSSNEQVRQLLAMTPHFYRASKEGRESACKLDELDITVDVVFNVLQKKYNTIQSMCEFSIFYK